MPINPGIIGGLDEPQQPKPFSAIMAQNDALEAAKARRDQVIAQAKDNAAIQAAMGAHASPDGSIDFDGVLSDIGGKVSPQAFEAFQKAIDEHRDKASLSMERDLKNKQTKLQSTLALRSLAHDQASYDAVRPSLLAIDPALEKVLPPQWDDTTTPKELDSLGDFALTEQQRIEARQKALAEGRESQKANQESTDWLAKLARTHADTPEDYAAFLQQAKTQMLISPKVLAGLPAYSPNVKSQLDAMLLGPKGEADIAHDKALEAQSVATQTRLEASQKETARHNAAMEERMARVAAGGGNNDDAKAIAEAIVSGDQPPSLTGLYRFAAPVRAELARQKYDLTRATEDWNSTTKYLQTLNGAQQVRLRQAVNFTKESLPIVEELAKEWKGSGLTLLNKAELALAAQGLKGQAAKSIAVRLQGQISDLVSELGTVYKGGNSSTDESLKLAGENLKADWDEKTLMDAVGQIRRNLTIRENSIKNTGVISGRTDNPYAPTSTPDQPTVTLAELQAIAKAKGTTVEVQQQRYEAGGYKVIK